MLQKSSQIIQINSVDLELPFVVKLLLNKVMITSDLNCSEKYYKNIFFWMKLTSFIVLPFLNKKTFKYSNYYVRNLL